MSVEFDTSDLDAFAADLAAMGRYVQREVKPVLRKAGVEIKKSWAADAASSRHFAQIAPTVNFDVTDDTNGATLEVGPDPRRRSARLENIWLFGGVNGGGGTGLEPLVHLDKELPNAEKYLGDIIEEVWG